MLILVAVCVTSPLWAQKSRTVTIDRSGIAYEKAKGYYDKDKYNDAIPLFEEFLQTKSDNQDALYYLGLSYRHVGRNKDAITQFKKLDELNPDYWPWFYYEAGNANLELDQFSDAITMYQKFLNKYSEKDASHTEYRHRAKSRIYYAQKSPEIRAKAATMTEPANLGASINGKWGDYSPQANPTEKIIYFTSKRKGGNVKSLESDLKNGYNETNGWDEDVYIIEKDGNGGWSKPAMLPEPINSDGNDFGSSFSGDGQNMVYVACGREGGVGSCDLYTLSLEGNKWSDPVNMGNIVNSKEWDSQPTMSSDGNTIIFSSTRDGGFGNGDLYVTTKNKFGDWGAAVNLGGIINTPFTEKSPFLSPDGKTLYFTSDGHPGFGAFDLFISVNDNGRWSEPQNLGKPLNSAGDDSYFTTGGSGDVGYFASTRSGGLGDLDLYSINIPESMRPKPTVVVSGTVTNAKDNKLLGAWVLVEDINSGELIATSKSNSETGKYLVVLPSGRNYSVSANREAFFFYSQSFEVPMTSRYQEIVKDIALKPIEKGAKVVINNIFFQTGKATLSPESRLELEKAVDLMKTNPSMVIEVGGHTDNVGDDNSNMKLSHDRAKSVRDYLVNAGITATRVQAKGYGESNPVATNDTEDGRRSNRRTEFIILEF